MPEDPGRSHPQARQLSENIFLIEDTCNVYLIRDGDAGLLIDAGSGAVREVLAEFGIGKLDWVVHTHHHRDQCWGTPRLVADEGVKVAAPEHEAYLFESAQKHWNTKRLFDNYNDRNTFFALGVDIAVDTLLEDYEEFRWRGISFFVLPAQGHTFGSIALIAEIDGRRLAFTGDLLTAGGHVLQLHALEYRYGDMAGVLFTLQSLQALRRHDLDCLLPSHGAVVTDVERDIDRLQQRLMDIVRLGAGVASTGLVEVPGIPATRFLPGAPLVQVSEHLLWSGPWACSNFYVLLSGTGEALLIDYGHAYWANAHTFRDQEPFETTRFIAHHIDELSERFGVMKIEAVIATHIHDDHTCGIPYLQRHHGTECWALADVAEILERPATWASAPFVLPTAIRVDRRFADGGRAHWRGIDLTFHHAPGQTEFHSVIGAEIDGKTVAFTGDNYFLHDVEIAGRLQRLPYQTTVFRNSFQLAMHRRCVAVMREIAPDLICPGHGEILPCDRRSLDAYADYVALKERAFRAAVGEPADQQIDVFWARLRPYLSVIAPGGTLSYTLVLRNNLERSAVFGARLLQPPGWPDAGGWDTVELSAGQGGTITLRLTAPDRDASVRRLVTAEVFIDGCSQGPVPEALVMVR